MSYLYITHRSEWIGSGNMYVDLFEEGEQGVRFLDLVKYSTPDTDSWITVTKEIPPSTDPILVCFIVFSQVLYSLSLSVLYVVPQKNSY